MFSKTIWNKSCWYNVLALLLGILLVLFSLFVALYAEDSDSILSVKELRDLAMEIEILEFELKNIKIKSEARVEEKKSPSALWESTPMHVSSTTWSDGELNGKIRIDVHKEVLRSKECTASCPESSYSIGFDGKEGRLTYRTMKYGEEITPSKKGKILPDAPERLRTGLLRTCTGLPFSFYFCLANEKYTFSQLFLGATDPKLMISSNFKFSREMFKDANCIKVTRITKSEDWYESWWLDPERGFALIGYEEISKRKDGSERVVLQIKVNKLIEVAPGIWWPTEATYEAFSSQRIVWSASEVLVNNPNFDDTIFTIQFPDGYLIEDMVNNTQYRVGGEDKEVVKEAISIEGRTLVRAIRKAEILYFDEKDEYTDKWENISGDINLNENKYFTTPPILTASGEGKYAIFTAVVRGSGEAEGVSVSIDKSGNITITGLE